VTVKQWIKLILSMVCYVVGIFFYVTVGSIKGWVMEVSSYDLETSNMIMMAVFSILTYLAVRLKRSARLSS